MDTVADSRTTIGSLSKDIAALVDELEDTRKKCEEFLHRVLGRSFMSPEKELPSEKCGGELPQAGIQLKELRNKIDEVTTLINYLTEI